MIILPEIHLGKIAVYEIDIRQPERFQCRVGMFNQVLPLFYTCKSGLGVVETRSQAEFSCSAANIEYPVAGCRYQEGRGFLCHQQGCPMPSGKIPDLLGVQFMDACVGSKPFFPFGFSGTLMVHLTNVGTGILVRVDKYHFWTYLMSIKHLFQIDQWDFQSKSIMSNLPAEDWQLLAAHMTEVELPKGYLLFREGTIPAGIHFLRKGKAKKYRADQDGHEQIIYVANSGELLGYHAVLSEDRYPDSCSLLEDSVIGFIPGSDFLAALERSPLLSRRLLKTLSHEFTVLANSLSLISKRSVRERTALQLVVLREKYKLSDAPVEPVEINLSREDLANMVGTARENVVRVLSEFKAEQLISTRGRKIIVLNVAGLIKLANFK